MRICFLYLFISVLLITITVSCRSTRKEYVLKVRNQQLSAASIYDKNLVYDVVFDARGMEADSLQYASRQLFLKGVDFYRNQKNPYKGIFYFKESLLLYPDAKTYYELGNALLDAERSKTYLEEADKAYDMALHLEIQPESPVWMKRAIVENQLRLLSGNNNTWSVVYMLRHAFETGPVDTNQVIINKQLAGISQDQNYLLMLQQVLASRHIESDNSVFSIFVKTFQEKREQISSNLEDVTMEAYRTPISYDFEAYIPEMENSSFGRDVGYEYFQVAKVAQTAEYVAVIYGSLSYFGENFRPVYLTLAVYTTKGEMIDRKMIGCQCSATEIKRFDYDNGKFTVEEYTREWEHPIDQVEPEKNVVKSFTKLSAASFALGPDGKINPVDVPSGFHDTILPVVQK